MNYGLPNTSVKYQCVRCRVCTIAPLDIERWNRHRLTIRKTTHLEHQAQYKEWQKTIERAIIQINKFIIEINIANHMITPFVGDTVMTKKGSRVKKHYEKFPDGLHPGDELIKIWGDQIATRIDANFSISGGAAAAVPTPSQKDDKKDTPEGDHSPTRSPKRNWKTYWERTPARHTYLYNILKKFIDQVKEISLPLTAFPTLDGGAHQRRMGGLLLGKGGPARLEGRCSE